MVKEHEQAREKKPVWVEIKEKELEELIVSLFNQGNSPSKIGVILRDQYGVPKAKLLAKKRLAKILKDHKLELKMPEDLMNLIRKSVAEYRHLEENKKDFKAKRGYQLTVSKIRRLTKYYIMEGKIPSDWRYTPEKASLLVK
ncbi:MAG: 30S ribosomal protein S15 [Candidatus Diapherotrites archaeon]